MSHIEDGGQHDLVGVGSCGLEATVGDDVGDGAHRLGRAGRALVYFGELARERGKWEASIDRLLIVHRVMHTPRRATKRVRVRACAVARVRTYEAVGEELVDGGECHTGDRTAGLL